MGGLDAPCAGRARKALGNINAGARTFKPISGVSVACNAPVKEETLVCDDFVSAPQGARVFRWQSSVS
jgi:hypothetical protein